MFFHGRWLVGLAKELMDNHSRYKIFIPEISPRNLIAWELFRTPPPVENFSFLGASSTGRSVSSGSGIDQEILNDGCWVANSHQRCKIIERFPYNWIMSSFWIWFPGKFCNLLLAWTLPLHEFWPVFPPMLFGAPDVPTPTHRNLLLMRSQQAIRTIGLGNRI